MSHNGITCSMGRSGNFWDNAAMESFFSSLKTERVRRYVATANGRGYRFVAPVERSGVATGSLKEDPENHNLPPGWVPPIGQEAVLDALRGELPARRFMTLVGPGGIGKTTVALALAIS